MKKVILISCILLGAFIVGCAKQTGQQNARPQSPAGETIKLGEYMPLTGDIADFGQTDKNGIALALREINEAGGVLGKKLEVVVEDDGSKPNQVPALVKKLISSDQVWAILGEVTSSASLEGAPLCQANKVPMITPAATNPNVTKKGDYIFRVCYTDTFQGEVCAKFASQNLKLARAAILKDIRAAYSIGLADSFKTHFQQLGGKIIAEESYSTNDTDFGAQLITIKSANPQVLFIPGYYNDVGLIIRKAKELGLKCEFLGGDGWDGPQLVEVGGKAVEGGYFSNHYSVDDPNPEVQKFVSAYEKEYGKKPGAMAALGYDAARVVADAIKRAGKLDKAAIRDALAQTKDFPGITGSITLDANRDCIKPAVILQVKDGKWKYVTTIKP